MKIENWDTMPVMYHHRDGRGLCESLRADKWFDEPIEIGDALTAAQLERVDASDGHIINNDVDWCPIVLLLDDAAGMAVHVYEDDPFLSRE